MATYNPSTLEQKIDHLTESLFHATPEQVCGFIDRQEDAFTPTEITCIQFAHRGALIDTSDQDAVECLWGDWNMVLPHLFDNACSERTSELRGMADSMVESALTCG